MNNNENATVIVKDRTIIFSGVIDSEAAGKGIYAIKSIEDEDNDNESHLKTYNREPINLIINSNGGNAYDALALIDVIETSKTPIHTYAYGMIMSAALPLFVAGDKRFCGRRVTFMHHEAAARIDDYSSIISAKAKEVERVGKVIDDVLIERTKVTDKMVKQWYNEREKYFDAQEALKLGIVHEIL